jgi:DNA-binding MarR family transcriptional regulator/GNAT superfamily N-acetyltransferase
MYDDEHVKRIRRFNRAVTQRVGALNDHFLSRDRPLGEARVLWEIGTDGVDVRALRSRLDLDSGYLSRLLRALERDGLVRVGPNVADRRVRRARLTDAGMAERAMLDQRSDELAMSILEPLTDRQRDRLVAAMADVERLLTASMVEIAPYDPRHQYARYCLQQYFTELAERFHAGFDPDRSISAADDELAPPAGLMLVATLHAEPIGCGALKFHEGRPTELKRMWIAPEVRGIGLARRLLAELEERAVAAGSQMIRLETNRTLREAITLYLSAGYREVTAFNDEPYADHWFEKVLPSGPVQQAS